MKLRAFFSGVFALALIAAATLPVETIGQEVYSIKRTNIAQTSQLISFGFTPSVVMLEFPATNTAEVCIAWHGYTATCPAANTAGAIRNAPGTTVVIDQNRFGFFSVIADSGTQTVNVRAFP